MNNNDLRGDNDIQFDRNSYFYWYLIKKYGAEIIILLVKFVFATFVSQWLHGIIDLKRVHSEVVKKEFSFWY